MSRAVFVEATCSETTRRTDPAEQACASEVIEACKQRLSGREAKVFFENALGDRSLKEIGDELGISESRACQIRRSAREKLAKFLAGRGEVPVEWLERARSGVGRRSPFSPGPAKVCASLCPRDNVPTHESNT